MAISIIAEVFAIQGIPSAAKFVLVALADSADDTGRCWPSVKFLCLKTSLDRKTVLSHIKMAMKHGIILDTGERVGATAQVRVLQFNLNGPKNGTVSETVPKTAPVPNFPPNGTKNGTRNRKESNHRFYGVWSPEKKTNGPKNGTVSDLYPGGRT